MKHVKNSIWHIVTPQEVLSISKVEKETPFNYVVFAFLFYAIPLDLFYKRISFYLFLPTPNQAEVGVIQGQNCYQGGRKYTGVREIKKSQASQHNPLELSISPDEWGALISDVRGKAAELCRAVN